MKPQKINLTKDQRSELLVSMRKIIGQMSSIAKVIEDNKVTDATFNQLLAVKGGTTRICKEIIAQGIIPNLQHYSEKQINQALNVIFKIDS
jgi:DNA-binding FrmR family transcriptional regulator